MMDADRVERLPKPLVLFVALVLALALGSWLDAAVGYLRQGKPGLSYLWMYYPGFDFVDYTLQFPYLHTPQFFTLPVFPWVYPAPAIFVLYPFYRIVLLTNRATGFAVFALAVLGVNTAVGWRFRAKLLRLGISRGAAFTLLASVTLFGWPLYFALQRGNIESLLWVGVALGVTCFARGRYRGAAILFGAVGSVKLYPLLFLALFLKPRRFGEMALGLGVAGVVTLLGLRCLSPDIGFAWQQIRLGIQRWGLITTNTYLPSGIGTDHSVFGLIKQCTLGGVLRYPHALDWYFAAAAVVCSALFLGRVVRLPRLNQLLFLACATVLLPPTSYDYTLVSMLIPWGWMV